MKRLWKVTLGKNGEFEAEALRDGILTVQFNMDSDISTAKDRDALTEILRVAYPDAKPKTLLNFASQLNQFVNLMEEGDLVSCPIKSTSTIAIGRVCGPYAPHPKTGRPTRPVTWLKTDLPRDVFKQDLLYSFGAFNTVCEVKRNSALGRVEEVLKNGKDPGAGAKLPLIRQWRIFSTGGHVRRIVPICSGLPRVFGRRGVLGASTVPVVETRGRPSGSWVRRSSKTSMGASRYGQTWRTPGDLFRAV